MEGIEGGQVRCPACEKKTGRVVYCKKCKGFFCAMCGTGCSEAHPEKLVCVTKKCRAVLPGTPAASLRGKKKAGKKKKRQISKASCGLEILFVGAADPLDQCS